MKKKRILDLNYFFRQIFPNFSIISRITVDGAFLMILEYGGFFVKKDKYNEYGMFRYEIKIEDWE